MAVTDKKRRMVTMPDGKQYPLMPKKKIPYTSTANTRAEAQEAVAQQQTPTPSVSPEAAAFAAGKVQNQQAYAAPKPTVNPYLDRDVAQQRAAMQAANNPSVSVNDKQGAYPNAEQFEKKYPYAHNLEQKDAAQKQVAAQQQAAAGSPIAYNKQGYTDAAQVEAMNKAILMQNAQRAEAQRQVAAQQAAGSAPNGYSKQGYPNAEEIEAQNQAMLRQMAENADRDAAQKRVAQQQAAESRVMPNDKQDAYPTAEQTETQNEAILQQNAYRDAAQRAAMQQAAPESLAIPNDKQGSYVTAEQIEADNQATLQQYADRDAAQKAAMSQAAPESQPNRDVQAFAEGKQAYVGSQEAQEPTSNNVYADRAAAQEAINRGDSGTQQDYNMFANNKQQGYPSSETPTQTETPQQEQPQQQAQAVNSQTRQAQPPLDPNSSTAGMDYLNSLYTDPKEEERLRKASVMNQRILAIGNALRHIGNIAYTVKGAPSMQFNDPVAEEQARYEKGKAVRDRANQQFYTYQRQKEAQDAAQRKWERQFAFQQANAAAQAAHRDRMAKAAEDNAASLDAYRKRESARKEAEGKARIELGERGLKQRAAHQNRMAGIAEKNYNLNKDKLEYLKTKGAGRGSSPYDYATPNGTITMPRNFTQTQKDQVLAKFDRYIDRSEMEKQMRSLGLNMQDPAQVRNFQFAKMLQEHQDVADYVSEKFKGKQEFTSNPLARPEEAAPHMPYYTPWGGGMNLGLDGLEDEEDEMNLGLE